MSYYLRSIQDEYDDKGNYIGNSEEGNRFHGVSREPYCQKASSANLSGININADPIEIEHASLEKDYPGSSNAGCPVCKFGTLIGRRDKKTFELLAEDNCILCGQRFIYSDLGRKDK